MSEIIHFKLQTTADLAAVEATARSLRLVDSSGAAAARSAQAVAQRSQDAARGLDRVDSSARGAGGGLSEFGQRALAAFTTVGSVVGVVGAVRQAMGGVMEIMEQAGRMEDLSVMTGERVGNLVVLQRMLENSGRSGNDIAPLFARIARAVGAAEKAASPAAQAFRTLGVDVGTFARLSPAEKVAALQQAISGLPDPLQRAQVAMQLFGESGMELLPLFTDMDGFVRARREVGSFAEAMERSSPALARAGDDAQLMGVRYRAAMVNLAEFAVPVLAQVSGLMERVPVGALAAGLGAVAVSAMTAAGAFTAMQVSSLAKASAAWITTLARTRLGLQSEESAVRSLLRAYHQLAAGKQAAGRASGGSVAAGGRGVAATATAGLGAAIGIGGLIEFNTARNEVDVARSDADRELLRLVTQLEKLGLQASSQEAQKQALDMIVRQLAVVAQEQKARPDMFTGMFKQTAHDIGFGVAGMEHSSDALKQAAQKLQDAARRIEGMTPEQLRRNALGAEALDAEAAAAEVKRLRELTDKRARQVAAMGFGVADDALEAEYSATEDAAERRRLLGERARLLSRTLGAPTWNPNAEAWPGSGVTGIRPQDAQGRTTGGLVGTPDELVSWLRRQVEAVQAQFGAAGAGTSDEQMDAWKKQLEGLRDHLAAARQLAAAYREEEAKATQRAIEERQRIAKEDFRLREWQLEQEERALTASLEAGVVAEEDYVRRRKEILRQLEVARASADGEVFDQIRYERGVARIDDEAAARRKSKETSTPSTRAPVEGDRLARIGGFLGNAAVAPINYARRTADTVEKMLQEQKKTNSLLPGLKTATGEVYQ